MFVLLSRVVTHKSDVADIMCFSIIHFLLDDDDADDDDDDDDFIGMAASWLH